MAAEGLSSTEAASLLAKHGPNALPEAARNSLARIALQALLEPMVLLLVACTGVYLVLGDLSEGLFLALSMGCVIVISIVQQKKAENALAKLRDLSSPRALVIRDGMEMRIPSIELVPGDLLVVQEGDQISADGTVLTSDHLHVDESLLTGESAPVRKRGEQPISSGTLVVKGQGTVRVQRTGLETEIGRIGSMIKAAEIEPTRLQREIRRIVWVFAGVGSLFCLGVAGTYAITRNDWLNGLLAGLSTAMALLPEEFPVVLTIFLALGAWRLSKSRVLTRHLASIENLGAVTVLCTDKTGTLTLNKMTVKALAAGDSVFDLTEGDKDLPETHHELLEFGALASHRNPFDPMEKAIADALVQKLSGTEHIHDAWELVQEYPLSDQLLAMSCVWRARENSAYAIAAKGAPEAVISLCRLHGLEAERVQRQAEAMANQGLRVLGVAKAKLESDQLPTRQTDFAFSFTGLIGLEDPIRPKAREAILRCLGAGIRVVMITGDHPATAAKIGREAGLDTTPGVLTGRELQTLDNGELSLRLKTVNIVARANPEQKLRIVRALQDNGEVVAMTGDGVNDAPSLKSADVGIAMGGRGTDVARESADLVLLDDRFESIVGGIERGRAIYSNIRHAMAFLFAVHVPIAGLSLLPLLLGWPLILFPVHIAFLEMIIDPACTMAFESRGLDPHIMKHPPRPVNRPIFSWLDIVSSSVAGFLICAVIAAGAMELETRGFDGLFIRSSVFSGLIMANLGLIYIFLRGSQRERTSTGWHRQPLFWISTVIASLSALIWLSPKMRDMFGFTEPSGLCLAAGAAMAAVGLGLAATWNALLARFR